MPFELTRATIASLALFTSFKSNEGNMSDCTGIKDGLSCLNVLDSSPSGDSPESLKPLSCDKSLFIGKSGKLLSFLPSDESSQYFPAYS